MTEMKTWVTPRASVQSFVPNDHVAMCYAAKINLECAIPGWSDSQIGDYWYTDSDHKFGDDKLLHGSCGTQSGDFDMAGNVGYEYFDGEIDTNRPIKDVLLGSAYTSGSLSMDIGTVQTNQSLWEAYDNGSTKFKATWTSTNDNWKSTYIHYGVATIKEMLKGGNANWSG